jgi:uncharacterized protein (TIGR00159 family)
MPHSITPFIEILIIAIMLNYVLSFIWKTKSKDLILGLLAFLLIMAASSFLNLPILHQILVMVSNVALIAIIIIFQPELRAALSKLTIKGKRPKEISEFDKFLDDLTLSVYRMAEKRIGALIVLEHEDLLDEYARTGVILNADFSSELLESVFAATTPLHDGALIIRNLTAVAASVILPLVEESSELSRSMGTRHRAALGLSEQADALIIVISEETGKISIAREGMMTRGIKSDRFKGIIRSVFSPSDEKESKTSFNPFKWFFRK